MRTLSILKLAVSNENLKDLYKNQVEKHNDQVVGNPFPNAGFDLFVPQQTIVDSHSTKSTMISMNVKAEMVDVDSKSLAYYMYPRSSISKTPLMLANHVGIIDAGYRGPLIGAFRNFSTYNYVVEKDTRLLQICKGDLTPFLVELVDDNDLSNTERGEGGFGSTGR